MNIHCCGNVYYPVHTRAARGRVVTLSVSSCLSAVCGHKNEQLANNYCLLIKRKTNESRTKSCEKARAFPLRPN